MQDKVHWIFSPLVICILPMEVGKKDEKKEKNYATKKGVR